MRSLCLTFHSFIHSGYFHSASSSPLLLRGAPDTARILCRSFTPKRHRQLRVKDLPKVPTWRPERDSNPWPFERKTANLPLSHHASRRCVPNKLSGLIDDWINCTFNNPRNLWNKAAREEIVSLTQISIDRHLLRPGQRTDVLPTPSTLR